MNIDVKKDMLHEKREFTDVRHLVEECCEMYKDRIAYSFRKKASDKEKVEIPFTKVREDVRALTTEFLARGYQGKHVAVIGKNSYEWYLCYFALLAADATIVPLDRDWLANDLAETVLKADCEVLICDSDIAEKTAVIAERCGIKDVYDLAAEGENSVGALV